ncbi:hypothetical protein [Salinicola halophyticus]|uniref:hypothetical protein n=1 Tax=Salinicola halophyticus TaxID=1808881 RepID=UPI003F45D290
MSSVPSRNAILRHAWQRDDAQALWMPPYVVSLGELAIGRRLPKRDELATAG